MRYDVRKLPVLDTDEEVEARIPSFDRCGGFSANVLHIT